MRWFLVLVGMAGWAGAAAAETPLYWALSNNDALTVWNLTAPDGSPAAPEDGGLDRPFLAVAAGSAEALAALSWRGVALDGLDSRGRNLLFGAAALGRLDLFETIQAAGARTDQIDAGGRTLVHAAALSPHPEMLRALLALGLGPREKSALGITPLMDACLAGKADEAEILLNWGSVPEDEDYLGRSVRDYAAASGDPRTLAVVDGALTPWTIGPAGEAPLP